MKQGWTNSLLDVPSSFIAYQVSAHPLRSIGLKMPGRSRTTSGSAHRTCVCPPSLPPAFAAKIHSEGDCCYAWLNGAVVLLKGEKKGEVARIRADFIKDPIEGGEDYLLLAMRRPTTSDFGKKEMSKVVKERISF
jgi:hypothetical protein